MSQDLTTSSVPSIAPSAPSPGPQTAAPKDAPPTPKIVKLTDMRFAVLDTETTGLDPAVDRVIELAMRGWSLNKRKKDPKVLEMLFHPGPGIKIPPVTSSVHHITDDMVRDCPVLEDETDLIRAFIKGRPILAYNANFDRGMLPFLHDHEWIDVYRLAMHLWSIGDTNEDGFALTSFKQQELRYWLKLPKIDGDAHRAGADTMITGMVFQCAVQKYLDAGHPNDYQAFVDWVASPIKHLSVPFGYKSMVGKRPEQLTTDQLKNVFNRDNDMHESYRHFNVLDFLQPEYTRRMLLQHSTQIVPEATRSSFNPKR